MWPCVHGSEIGDRCVSTSHVTDTVVHHHDGLTSVVCGPWVCARARASYTAAHTTQPRASGTAVSGVGGYLFAHILGPNIVANWLVKNMCTLGRVP